MLDNLVYTVDTVRAKATNVVTMHNYVISVQCCAMYNTGVQVLEVSRTYVLDKKERGFEETE